ncbi:phosphotransferase family enzyme [Haloactinospora alba]|uniref:Phosphotransferase family enzyme n=1 Tax=Haloactinospora alba TaxID=405555 RepID=A0A543NEK9_9ACTN|nr:aminoglycoside phosphotransferase family protein [Haloactinospora alba]TQN30278.1 phosphotransferase family enzyme [Haloactinospora alba]
MAVQADGSLTQEVALRIAAQAGAALGLAVAERRVLGPVGTNASVLLPTEGIVLRITATDNAQRLCQELDVAAWLNSAGVPAVRPARSTPVKVAGWLVSLWHEVAEPRMATSAELGGALCRLHSLAAPEQVDLPPLEPLRGVEQYLQAATGISAGSRSYLTTRLEELRHAFQNLQPALPPGPVHGDAHRKNFAHTPSGEIVAMDLERVSTGPREWDLVVAAVYRDLEWYTASEYAAFVRAYGYDVRDWDGYDTLADIRRLRMTAWLSARTGREPRLTAEAEHRIATLRTRPQQFDWTPGV